MRGSELHIPSTDSAAVDNAILKMRIVFLLPFSTLIYPSLRKQDLAHRPALSDQWT
jgi:hypothetical protein